MTQCRRMRHQVGGFKFAANVLDYHNSIIVPQVIIDGYKTLSRNARLYYIYLLNATKNDSRRYFTYDLFRCMFWDNRPSKEIDKEAAGILQELVFEKLVKVIDVRREIYKLLSPDLRRE